MSNDLEKALELLRQVTPRVEGMHLAQGCRADQGHIGLLREIDTFLASQQEWRPEVAQDGRCEYTEFEGWLEREKPAGCIGDMERGWMARAALAQPSQKCATCNDSGVIGGFVGADSGYQDDPCPDCAQPSPAPELPTEDELEAAGLTYPLTTPDGRRLTASMLRIRFDEAREAAARTALENLDETLAAAVRQFQFRDIRPKAASEIDDLGRASKLLGHTDKRITETVYRRVGEVVDPTR